MLLESGPAEACGRAAALIWDGPDEAPPPPPRVLTPEEVERLPLVVAYRLTLFELGLLSLETLVSIEEPLHAPPDYPQ